MNSLTYKKRRYLEKNTDTLVNVNTGITCIDTLLNWLMLLFSKCNQSDSEPKLSH
jgi:hypothetical protein